MADGMIYAHLTLLMQYLIAWGTYNLYFHPLSKYPGPKLWAISRVPYAMSLASGNVHTKVKQIHDQYGEIVRLAPNEVSFINAQAWQDIHGHHTDFLKSPQWIPAQANGYKSIVSATKADHSRYRRLLLHAFSEKALRDQEPILQSYVSLLIRRLREITASSGSGVAVINIVEWYNFVTFDIIGDLGFNESFHCLDESRYHPWVKTLFDYFKVIGLGAACRLLPPLDKILRLALPKEAVRRRREHFNSTKDKLHRRIAQGEDPSRKDFMSYVLKYNDEKGMSVPEMEANFSLLVVAGSETTGTALSGMTNCLAKDPERLRKLTVEIRESFADASKMSINKLSRLPYLGAVIEEGLRLCPPVAVNVPRVVPAGGARVCGHWFPASVSSIPGIPSTFSHSTLNTLTITKQTSVVVQPYASNRSPLNFSSPDSFHPERWLDPASTDNAKCFQPFSVGPRNCIGRSLAYLEMRLILARLLLNFDLALPPDGSGWRGEWAEQKTYILWDKKPFEVMLTPVGKCTVSTGRD